MNADVAAPQTAEDFVAGLSKYSVTALWTLGDDNVPLEPGGAAVPHVWPYEDVRREMLRAGELVAVHDSDRRVLGYHNPGLKDMATTDNLFAGLQLVMPGEMEAAHRHTSAAVRFVVEGDNGAYTTVNGERAFMARHDLILTPGWQWHDHANESDEPIIWMDGLDMPMIRRLNANFYEEYTQGRQEPTQVDDGSTRAFSSGRLDPTWWQADGLHSPIIKYPWASVARTLQEVPRDHRSMPDQGFIFEYTNPRTGGPLMPTLGCQIELIPADTRTAVYQRVHSAVYNVISGNGSAMINGTKFNLNPSDVMSVPIWATAEITNESDEDLVLFVLTDKPVYERLGIYREATLQSR